MRPDPDQTEAVVPGVLNTDEAASELSGVYDFVVFAGSGVERGAGVPGWRKLLEQIKDRAGVPDEVVDNDRISNCSGHDFPDVAQMMFEHLMASRRGAEWYSVITRALQSQLTPYTAQQVEIFCATPHVVTTNFGMSFEEAYRVARPHYRVQSANHPLHVAALPDFDIAPIFAGPSVVYLHGRADAHHIILTRDEYERYYPLPRGGGARVPDVEQFLRHLYEQRTVVFVGFSFRDECFLRCLRHLHEGVKLSDEVAGGMVGRTPRLGRIRHYAFVMRPERGPSEDPNGVGNEHESYRRLCEELVQMHISPVEMRQYIDWMQCFSQVRPSRGLEFRATQEGERSVL